MRSVVRLARPLLLLCLAVFALLAGPAAHATKKWPQAVLLTLPPYCADSELSHQYNRFGPRWQYWTSRMGQYFNSIHHYCEGMLNMREARRLPAGSAAQMAMLKRAINEYNYLLEGGDLRVLRTFPLWPEMLLRRGEAAVLMGDWALATASYEQARIVKPDYWPAYLDWAEVLGGLKLNTQARDLLKQGLMIDPTVEPMRKAFVKFGGSLKDIPAEAPKKPDEAASAPADPAASAPVGDAAAPASPASAASR